jgi:TRAP-type C4-dicarboxylate transport system substrate-binding protein
MVDRIDAATNGRLKITTYPAGELLGAMELPDALAAGTIEMGFTWPNLYYGGMQPETSALDTPAWYLQEIVDPVLVYNQGLMGVPGLKELYEKDVWEDLMGVKCFMNFYGSGETFWSREPMYSVADLAGYKVRFYGDWLPHMTRMGAAPVYLPHEEVYQAVATGVLDGSGTAITYWMLLHLYEVTSYVYLPLQRIGSFGGILVGMDAWNSLPADMQAQVEQAIRLYAFDVLWTNYLDTVTLIDQIEPVYGGTILYWSDEDIAAFTESGKTWLTESAARSPLNYQAMKIYEDFAYMRGYVTEKLLD